VERFQRGLVFKACRLFHHLTLGSRVIKKKILLPLEPRHVARPHPEGVRERQSAIRRDNVRERHRERERERDRQRERQGAPAAHASGGVWHSRELLPGSAVQGGKPALIH